MNNVTDYGFDTRAVRGGQARTCEGEHNDPIFVTSSFVFESARQAAARFAHEEPGNVYSRFTNPTVRVFEQRLAQLEGGDYCVATSSGMSAILSTCLALLRTGDHIVASHSLFGATVNLFTNVLSRFGIETTFVALADTEAWARAMRAETRILFVETPSNPLMEIADMQALADLAHSADCMLVVDNCACTPVLQQPLKFGTDIVIHSATKYLDGQGRCVGGAIVTKHEKVATDSLSVMRSAGPSMSPFNAWVFLKGLETLTLRVETHSSRALVLAQWLEEHASVKRVHYPGLTSHPQHALASKQQTGFGGLIAFEIEGDREEAWTVIDSVRFISITANFGDAKSTITHPASTTHGRLTPEERARAEIGEGLLRISVGLEDLDDLKSDLGRGLDAIAPPTVARARGA